MRSLTLYEHGVLRAVSDARGWPAGYSCTHEGSFDDPEFNNVHVSVVRDAPEIPG